MPATADDLRGLHDLHRRAKALRDRLASGPKTLASRQAVLATRRSALESGREALKKTRADQKLREGQVQGITAKVEDLRAKLNAVKKQAEYDAIRNQIAHDNLAVSRLEDEILELMSRIEAQEAALKAQEAEVATLAAEVDALKADLDSKAEAQAAQLKELEAAIVESEAIIPADQRDRYRRTLKQHGADALAPVEGGACTGCFVSVTPQMMNELINREHLAFCMTCGRILYLEEDHHPSAPRRASR